MATWVRLGTGTAPTSTDVSLVGDYALDNASVPGDWPGFADSVRVEWSIVGASFNDDDSWDDDSVALETGVTEISQHAGGGSTGNKNTTVNNDNTDSTGLPGGLSDAQWEAALLRGDGADIPDEWVDHVKVKGPDGGTLTAASVTVTITYTPAGGQTIAVGTLAETNSLVGVQARKLATIGTLAEVESLIPAQARKVAPIGTLAESETLLSIQARKFATIGTFAESNNLIPVAVIMGGGQDIAVTTLAEIESLLAVSAEKTVQVGVMSEINNLIGVAGSKTAQIGVLAEADVLIGVEALKPIFQIVGTLGESNLLNSISALKVAQIGTLSETEILIAIQALKPIIQSVGTLAELNALIAIVAEVLGQGWWTKNPTGFTKNPTPASKNPTVFTKIKAGDPSPW